jgi:hypothetical protein
LFVSADRLLLGNYGEGYDELPGQWELCFGFGFRWHVSANGLSCGADSKANEYFAWIRLWIGVVHCRVYRRCKIPTRGNVRMDHLADRGHPDGHILGRLLSDYRDRRFVIVLCCVFLLFLIVPGKWIANTPLKYIPIYSSILLAVY